jgi:hypothetical protein
MFPIGDDNSSRRTVPLFNYTADCVPRLRHWSDKGLVLFAGQTLRPVLEWPDDRTSFFER